jgi:hypothetical protein
MARRSYETANGILAAARELGFDEGCFHQLPGSRALPLLDRIFDTFTVEGRSGRNRHWLWNDLRGPSAFIGIHDFGLLQRLGQPSTPVWLIAEDFAATKRGAPFWAFEATLSAAAATLDNHHLLEFYVVSRPLTWLVGENHHDIWFAAGEHAVAMLEGIAR